MVLPAAAGYDGPVAGIDEPSARSTLAAMQDRLARDPMAALGLGANATADEVRSAFLELTKVYHPVRFGRMAVDIQKLSNEVFLALRSAHDAIAKSLRRRTGPLPTLPARGLPAPGLGAPAMAPAHLPPGHGGFSTGYAAHGTGPHNVSAAPAFASAIPSGPSGGPGAVTSRLSGVPSASTAAGHSSSTSTSAGHAAGQSAGQPGSSSGARSGRPWLPGDSGERPPVLPRTITPTASIKPPPTRPLGATGSPVPTGLPTSRPPGAATNTGAVRQSGGHATAAAAAVTEAAVLDLLQRQQWAPAKTALHQLQARDPHSKRIRALMCYARGREAQLDSRLDDARVELQDALEFDPSLQLAKAALTELFTRRK